MKTPTFAARTQLARYIDEGHRLSGNRPAVAAFLPDPPSENPINDHLSVNSLEVERIACIAAYHRWKWQNNIGRVAVCVHTVFDYSDAGRKCGVQIDYNRHLSKWQFQSAGAMSDAYRHRPVLAHNNPLGSPSHCGVEFTRVLNEHKAGQFARRLTGKGRFHLL